MNDLDPNLESDPSDVHVHATAVKSDITKHKSKHKEVKERRKRSKDRDHKPKPSVSSKKVTQPQDYDSAQKLATKLTAKLMSVLPPEPGPDKYQRVDSETVGTGAERGRDKSRETRVRERKSASPDKRDNGDGRQQRIKKTARSKSEIIQPNNVRELIDEQQEHANNGMTVSSKDKNQQQPKEVTIAKLGPFKMSLEVKNNDKQGVAASGESKTKERKSRQSKGPEEVKKASTLEKEKSSSSQNEKRKRSRSKSAYSKSKDETKKSEVRKEPEASKRPETNFDEIRTEAEYLKYESQVSSESKNKKKKKQKEKIVVSKLAKSDRPVREKSPEKVVKVDNSKIVASSLADHSREVKYKPDAGPSSKFSRSVSQPAPPPEFDKLLLSTDSQIGLKRNLSLIMDEKEKQPRLKRSSTARDDFSNSGNQKHSRSKLVEQLTESSSGQGSRSDKMSLYDNYGFDSSPDLGQTANNEKRQQTLLHLKDTIKSQLLIAGAETSSANVKEKQRKLKDAFFPSLKMADEDSDTSDEANRDSPPTQIQSLSEESSGGSTRRRKTGQSSSPVSIRFDSSDDSEAGDQAAGAHVSDPGAVLSLGLVHNSSTAALLHSTEEEDSEEDEFSAVPVSASNPHVKLPVHGFPVPVPRTSLQTQAKDTSDNGCDSDSTIDIRIRKSEYTSRKSPCPVANQEVDEDWEVPEDSSDNDDITDIDTTSIITDSLAQQMMY